MMSDPTPPYRVPDFCPDCREKFLAVVGWIAPALESALSPAPPEPITTPENTLRRAGISNERQALYQRRMSSLLAGREEPREPSSGPACRAGGGGRPKEGEKKVTQTKSPVITPGA